MTGGPIDAALMLTVISGVAWTTVYISAIRVGLRQRTYAIPVLALALNLAWESTYGPLDLRTALSGQSDDSALAAQAIISIIWALADVVIVYTFLKYGRADLPRSVTRAVFVAWAVLVFASAYAVQWLFILEFGATHGSRYSAFLQNLLMSGLFIAMFVSRRGLRGQTMTIAVAKWIGTLAPTILFGPMEHSGFILGIGILCSVFDLVYIGLVGWAKRRPDAFAVTASSAPAPASAAMPPTAEPAAAG